ncbi:hypothetical protein [Mucilaginibacter sp.]|uniref:hypothetical protein n=1 Tax=Mucilaginibacter sp. TaxID=1882438 RepID=UPI00260E74F3|nr:hypothetical protein [Mucilaginibacter sp.]MDB4926549.1 hypothetical protein [Mucilaginibacter sp.]
MKRNDFFDNHPIYKGLGYNVIVGLIQLLTDECLLNSEERNGWYIKFINFRNSAVILYKELNNSQKVELIEYLRYKAYLDDALMRSIHNARESM